MNKTKALLTALLSSALILLCLQAGGIQRIDR